MIAVDKNTDIKAFGDFQTPMELAKQATALLVRLGISPRAVLEPSCGRGAFVRAAMSLFPDAELICGVEINSEYVESARRGTKDIRVRIFEGDFFALDWAVVLAQSPGPWLIIGNPPWVTTSNLSGLGSKNAPKKQNNEQWIGIEAITGKSNFDISEWMLRRYLEWTRGQEFTIAVLCKVSVARKVLASAWKMNVPIAEARIYGIDAQAHFGAAVEACFFILRSRSGNFECTCQLFNTLDQETPTGKLSYIDGKIINDAAQFQKMRHLLGTDSNYQWRSGIKHDCSKVMEFLCTSEGVVNGFGQVVDLEPDYVYPFLKSSDLTSARPRTRKLLVPQRSPGENVSEMKHLAPKTWQYLVAHTDLLRQRGSSIYRKKGDFAIFGVGPYSFTPWKVAISGFYKKLSFSVVGPRNGSPVVFDDTVYFLPCYSESEAKFVAEILNHEVARDLLESMVHWDSKRPITVELLRRVNLRLLAQELGKASEYDSYVDAADKPLARLSSFGLFKAS